MQRLVVATRNAHKVTELLALIGRVAGEVSAQLELCTLDALGITDEVVEDGETFADNAIKKALAAVAASGLPALADDSGLSVDVLDGAPGVHSARYAGEPKSDARNNEKLLRALVGLPEGRRSARFVCTLCLAVPASFDGGVAAGLPSNAAPTVYTVRGECHGQILFAPRGHHGFGYDPLFLPDRAELEHAGMGSLYGKSYAELHSDEKNRISHRARAVAALVPLLRSTFALD